MSQGQELPQAGSDLQTDRSAQTDQTAFNDVDSGDASLATSGDLPSGQPDGQEVGADEGVLGYFQRVHGQDLSHKYRNDEEALNGLLEAYRLVGRRDDDAILGQQLRPLMPQIQQMMAGGQHGQQQQQPVSDVPEFNPEWQQNFQQDPTTGELRWTGDPQDKKKFDQFQEFARKRVLDIVRDPGKVLGPMIQQEAARAAQQIVQQQFSQQHVQATAQQIMQQKAPYIFNGGDPRNGMTPQGEIYAKGIMEADQLGIRDPQQADRYAMNVYWAQVGYQQSQQTPAQQPAQQRGAPEQRGAPAKRPNAQLAAHQPQQAARGQQRGAGTATDGLSLRDRLAKVVTDDFMNQ